MHPIFDARQMRPPGDQALVFRASNLLPHLVCPPEIGPGCDREVHAPRKLKAPRIVPLPAKLLGSPGDERHRTIARMSERERARRPNDGPPIIFVPVVLLRVNLQPSPQ